MNTHTSARSEHPEQPEQPEPVKRLVLRLPSALAEQLRRLAQAHDRSLNGELVRALRAYVERERSGDERSGDDGA